VYMVRMALLTSGFRRDALPLLLDLEFDYLRAGLGFCCFKERYILLCCTYPEGYCFLARFSSS
jgi:hypothetical protein